MIYVTSDLHGYPLPKFLELLRSASFSDHDFLFVLGDVIDRGENGAELLRWLTEQPNVQLILGNHEAMMLACGFLFDDISEESLAALDSQALQKYAHWQRNGAEPTLEGLKILLKENPDVFAGIMDYLKDAPLYDTVTAGGRDYILVHAGLGNFRPDRPLSDYTPHELIWTRPTLDTAYFQDALVIFGHTPTHFIDPESNGRAIKTDSWICIDTGVATGNKPMLLRLDDLKEFYA